MKVFLFQTLFFILLSQSAGIVLNILWLKEPLYEVVIESLIAGISSSVIYFYFVKAYKKKQEALRKTSVN